MTRRGGSKRQFRTKKLPHASKKIDDAQNKKLVNMEKKLRNLQQEPELKHTTDLFPLIPVHDVPATTSMVLLNGIAQGALSDNRIGDDVRFTSLIMRGIFNNDPNTSDSYFARFIVFWDRQPNGSAPLYTDLLDASATPVVIAQYNTKYTERFTVLWDHTVKVKPSTIVTTSVPNSAAGTPYTSTVTAWQTDKVYINKYIKLARKTHYGLAGTDSIAAISTNSLYLLVVGDYNAAGTNDPELQLNTRVYFKDA